MRQPTPPEKFAAALDTLVADVRKDRSVLAAVLCGSLSHDTVWDKSDIDLVFITVDDRKVEEDSISLYADGLNVHATLMPRTKFRRAVEGATQNSFIHSLFAKGRLLYTHDETISELYSRLRQLGERDRDMQLLGAASTALYSIYKARKWFITRGDLEYTALWILYAATALAKIEVIGAGQIADREVIPQAAKLNPAFFTTIYTDLLNERKTKKAVGAALAAAEEYMTSRTSELFKPIVEYLKEVGEARSCREIDHYFKRHYDIDNVITACEYLSDQDLIGKVSIAVRLTKKSNVDVQELAFVYLGEPDL